LLSSPTALDFCEGTSDPRSYVQEAIEKRLAEVEQVNARLESAALTASRAMAEISKHWDAVYEAMRRTEEQPVS